MSGKHCASCGKNLAKLLRKSGKKCVACNPPTRFCSSCYEVHAKEHGSKAQGVPVFEDHHSDQISVEAPSTSMQTETLDVDFLIPEGRGRTQRTIGDSSDHKTVTETTAPTAAIQAEKKAQLQKGKSGFFGASSKAVTSTPDDVATIAGLRLQITTLKAEAKSVTAGKDKLIGRLKNKLQELDAKVQSQEALIAQCQITIDQQREELKEIQVLEGALTKEKMARETVEQEFDDYIEFMEDDGTIDFGEIDEVSILNQKVADLFEFVRKIELVEAVEPAPQCFYCFRPFNKTRWRHTCEKCKETFCSLCCSKRTNIPGTPKVLCCNDFGISLIGNRARYTADRQPHESYNKKIRTKEKRIIEKLTVERATAGKNAKQDVHFMIDSEWLSKWKQWISGGAERPPPISNQHLHRVDGQLKEGLVRGKDYRCLNQKEWMAFYDWYGGGPPVRRASNNIYGEPVYPKAKKMEGSARLKKYKQALKEQGKTKAMQAARAGKERQQEEALLRHELEAAPRFGGLKEEDILGRTDGLDKEMFSNLRQFATENPREAKNEFDFGKKSSNKNRAESSEESGDVLRPVSFHANPPSGIDTDGGDERQALNSGDGPPSDADIP